MVNYSHEGSKIINENSFKTQVADIEIVMSRDLYQSIDRNSSTNQATIVTGSNDV